MHPLSRRLIDRAPAGLATPASLTVRTIDGAIAHRLPGLAAELAFWVVLSLPALVLTIVATAGVLAGDANDWSSALVERVVVVARVVLSERSITDVLRPLLESLLGQEGVGALSFSLLATVWVVSRAVKVVLTAIALTTGRGDEARPGWQQRLLGLALTLGTLLVGTVLAPLLLAGPGLGERLTDLLPAEAAFLGPLWRASYWPVTIVLAMLGLSLLYHLGAPGPHAWRWDLPGAILATVLWLIGSGGLRLYGTWVVEGGGAYGPLAGPIVGLLWLWLTGLAVLVGSEFNSHVRDHWSVWQPPSPDATDMP